MTDSTDIVERDKRNGRFVTGGIPGPGRKVGSRNKLSTDFLRDLHETWAEHGATALRLCATTDPGKFCTIVAGLLPRDVDINVSGNVDVGDFAQRFRAAVALLGNEPGPKVIEHVTRKRR
jgi:hypothetical protein